ncbi:MAG: hypothetical protein HYZ07_01755 [Candidatus Harrisonbacteria bacterium]|nr:hypothetical protein [Candidatus Harrisonbacteria bacterium]
MRHHICCVVLAALFAGQNTAGEDGEPTARSWSAKELTDHYVAQVAKLRAAGYPELFGGGDCFEQRFSVNRPAWSPYASLYDELVSAAPLWVDDEFIPFLIVIPEECAPLLWQATRVKTHGIKADAPQFPVAKIVNAKAVATPRRKPYFIFNVNTGAKLARTSVVWAEREFANPTCPRRGLTFAEGVALLIQEPDAIKCERGIDEDYREHFAYGNLAFLSSYYGGEPRDKSDGDTIAFVVRRDELHRGYFVPVPRGDMTPNYTRFIYPSCDATAKTE